MKTTFKTASIIILSLMMLFNACTSSQKKKESVRVLLITGGHGFDKEPFYAFIKSLPGIVVTEVKHPDALDMFRPENRSSYDVVYGNIRSNDFACIFVGSLLQLEMYFLF